MKSSPAARKSTCRRAEHSLVLRDEDVNHERQHDLDDKGIAKTAREEKKRARDEKLKEQAKNEQMMKMYREHVLGEKPQNDLVPLGSLSPRRPRSRPRRRKKSAPSATSSIVDLLVELTG